LALGLVFVQVLGCLLIIRIISLYFPKDILKCLNLKYLLQQCSLINKYILFSLYIWLLLFLLISYYKFGVRTYIMPDNFAIIGKELPYWFTSMRTIYNMLAFFVLIGLFSNIVNSKRYYKLLWIILTLVFVPTATIYGRRYFIQMLIASVIFWFAYTKERLFRLRYLTVVLAVLGAFFFYSNFFQAYRFVFQTVGQVSSEKLQNPFSAALDFKSTISNLTQRPGTWEFNFLVINHQFNQPGMTTNGKVTWEALKSSIPRFFWPDKQFALVDDILANLYAVHPKDIDIGKNLFGQAQVDYGYYSIIIVSAVILLITFTLGCLVRLTINYPTFLGFFTANILFYLVNIEENGNEIFFMFRYIFIIFMLWLIYVIGYKVIYITIIRK